MQLRVTCALQEHFRFESDLRGTVEAYLTKRYTHHMHYQILHRLHSLGGCENGYSVALITWQYCEDSVTDLADRASKGILLASTCPRVIHRPPHLFSQGIALLWYRLLVGSSVFSRRLNAASPIFSNAMLSPSRTLRHIVPSFHNYIHSSSLVSVLVITLLHLLDAILSRHAGLHVTWAALHLSTRTLHPITHRRHTAA